jgi:hypothetical protein
MTSSGGSHVTLWKWENGISGSQDKRLSISSKEDKNNLVVPNRQMEYGVVLVCCLNLNIITTLMILLSFIVKGVISINQSFWYKKPDT